MRVVERDSCAHGRIDWWRNERLEELSEIIAVDVVGFSVMNYGRVSRKAAKGEKQPTEGVKQSTRTN
jgi:hypothetical protein